MHRTLCLSWLLSRGRDQLCLALQELAVHLSDYVAFCESQSYYQRADAHSNN